MAGTRIGTQFDFFPKSISFRSSWMKLSPHDRSRVPATLLCTLLFLSLLMVATLPADATPGDVYLIDSKAGGNWFEILHGQTISVTPATPREGLVETWFGNISTQFPSNISLAFRSEHETVEVFSYSNATLTQFAANVTWNEEYQIELHNHEPEDRVNITSYAIWGRVLNITLNEIVYDFKFTQSPNLAVTETTCTLTFEASLVPFTFILKENGTEIHTDTIHDAGITTHIWSKSHGLHHVELELILGADPDITLYWDDWYGNDTSQDPFAFISISFFLNQTYVRAVGSVNRQPTAIRAFENGTQVAAQYTDYEDDWIGSFDLAWTIDLDYRTNHDVYVIVVITATFESLVIDTPYDYTVSSTGVITTPTTTTTTTTNTSTNTNTTNPLDNIDWSVVGPQLAVGALALLGFMLLSYLFVLNEKSKEPKEEVERTTSFTKLVADKASERKAAYLEKIRQPPVGEIEVTKKRMLNRVLLDFGTAMRRGVVLIIKGPCLLLGGAKQKSGELKEKYEYKDWHFEADADEEPEESEDEKSEHK